jgi:COP9 signalosome complex subunit 5
MSNNIMEVNASEEIYKYDRAQQQSMLAAKPWEKDPHFFKEIKILGFRKIFKWFNSKIKGGRNALGYIC